MPAPTHFLIAGATGRQGGAAVSALLNDPTTPIPPSKMFAITRDPTSAASTALSAHGVHLLQGSLSSSPAIFTNLKQQHDHGGAIDLSRVGVFLAQAHGPTELADAKQFITAAAEAGVAHFVYSSVDRGGREASDRDASYCKTFSDKFLIEKHLISVCAATAGKKGGMSYTIIRPTWFADNALWGFPGKLCMTGWRDRLGAKRMQITCVKDIGRWAAEALLRPERAGLKGEAVSIASEALSYAEADRIFREETGEGIAVANGWLTWAVIWLVKDLRTMFGWIDERPYGADLEWLGRYVQPTTFRDWARDAVVTAKNT
jgi:uncharacterized protein YbjT (DUF2867 family)